MSATAFVALFVNKFPELKAAVPAPEKSCAKHQSQKKINQNYCDRKIEESSVFSDLKLSFFTLLGKSWCFAPSDAQSGQSMLILIHLGH